MKKRGIISFFIILMIPLFLTAVFVIVIDPFFHYHAPIKGYPYVLSEERYQNDGIVKHFDYEALITGSSMTQNFKTSDVENYFGKTAVKVSFAGGSFKETCNIVSKAIDSNKDLKMVIRGMDITRLNVDKDDFYYDDYPEYMYDNNFFNDYDYWFNKDVLIMIGQSFSKIIKGEKATTFDKYSNFSEGSFFGKEAVLSSFDRIPEGEYEEGVLTEEDYSRIRGTIEQNFIQPARANRNVTHYLFVPPVSVCYWDAAVRTNCLDYTIDELKYTYELLFEEENIRVFGFDDCIDITGNLDNYMDTMHYSEDINSFMIKSMAAGEHELTGENYLEYLERVRENYSNFDYDSIFE